MDHDLLRETVKRFLSKEVQIGDLRALRAERCGFDRNLWTRIAEAGWAEVTLSAPGEGFGYSALGTVLTELGRRLTPTPFLSTVVLSGEAIRRGGSPAQQDAFIPEIVRGRRLLAFAHQEGPVFRPYDVRVSAQPSDVGFLVRGSKTLVLDGHAADSLVLVARTSGTPGERHGLTLLLVDTSLPGVRVLPGLLLDSRLAATVEFGQVEVSRDRILGEIHRAAEIIDPILVRGALALAAEMLGGIEECFSRTVEYLRERRQFGVPIGSFQALQHRAADWCCEVELTRAIVDEALELADDGETSRLAAVASAAKARASEVFMRSAVEAIQMFAGVGMTDAHDIGFFLKRARVAGQVLGDAAYHRTRFAEIRGL